MNTRIKELRKNDLKLTQAEFAKPLEITGSAVSYIESGKATPDGKTINLICSAYNVNREWLETGEGEMFEPLDDAAETAQLIESISDSPAMRSLLSTWAQLSDENKAAFEAFAAAYVEDYNRRKAEEKIARDEALVDEAASVPDAEQKNA